MIDGTQYECEIYIENPTYMALSTVRKIYLEHISFGVFLRNG